MIDIIANWVERKKMWWEILLPFGVRIWGDVSTPTIHSRILGYAYVACIRTSLFSTSFASNI